MVILAPMTVAVGIERIGNGGDSNSPSWGYDMVRSRGAVGARASRNKCSRFALIAGKMPALPGKNHV